MATFQIQFFSNALQRTVGFNMYIPNDPRQAVQEQEPAPIMKTGFFLHGYMESAERFWELTWLAEQYHFAMVMPSAENSFYLDHEATGYRYCTYVGKELVEYVRKTFGLALRREDTFVAGFSMGGFGALHTGFAYPEHFGKIVALSSALIVHEVGQFKEGQGNSVANYAYYSRCFGKLEELEKSENNPEIQLLQLLEQKKKIPEIYMACGTEDFLLQQNRAFHQFLEQLRVEHIYLESAGNHDMIFWRTYFEKAAKWLA